MALVRGSRTTLAVGKECPYYNKGFTSGQVAWRGNVVTRIRGPYGEWYDRVEMKTAADADAESAAFDARMAECADCGRAPHGQKNLRTCWGDSAYQKCPKNRQGAYDLVQASVSKDGDQAKAHAVYLKLLADGFTGRVACSKAIPAIPEPQWPAQEGNARRRSGYVRRVRVDVQAQGLRVPHEPAGGGQPNDQLCPGMPHEDRAGTDSAAVRETLRAQRAVGLQPPRRGRPHV